MEMLEVPTVRRDAQDADTRPIKQKSPDDERTGSCSQEMIREMVTCWRRRSQRPYSRQDWRTAQYIRDGRRGSATGDTELPQQKSRRAEQRQTAAGNAGADQSDDMRLTTVFLLVALVMAACLTQMAYGNHEKSGGGGGGHDHGKGHSDGDGHGHDGR
ncbi:uncharacterized protein LOC124798111 [Schistocerca piceifrons]|uniref:uncharacterized protein LOC124798111 n=1 Tax=Schistocerca piceifrons TaxID=274613 RepID=UPI001F5F8139|nr:uncharacterized protein LOC124798111 [Schistocerca piceifrons]